MANKINSKLWAMILYIVATVACFGSVILTERFYNSSIPTPMIPALTYTPVVLITAPTLNVGVLSTPTPTQLAASTPTQLATFAPTQLATSAPTQLVTVTNTFIPPPPNATQTLQAFFDEIDRQFSNTIQANIAFNKPDEMKRGETTLIELSLNPSISVEAIATDLIEHSDFATSTAEPEQLIAPGGVPISVETATINISPRMKAVLLSQDPEAFIVTPLHDSSEQVIVPTESTHWYWSITAKEEGTQVLNLTLYQLLEYDGEEFWHEIETFHTEIVVKVTVADRLKAWDWKWLAGYTLTFIGTLLALVTWLKNNWNNKPAQNITNKSKEVPKR